MRPQAVVATAALAALLTAALPAWQPFGVRTGVALAAAATFAAATAAAVVLVLRARRGGRAWAWTAGGMASFALAEAYWFATELRGMHGAEATPADVAYLVGYAMLGIGFASLLPFRGGAGARRLLDGTVLAISFMVIAWILLLRPRSQGEDWLGAVLASAYPALDLALLALLFVVAAEARGAHASIRLLAAAMLVLTLGDLAYALQVLGFDVPGTVDWLWVAGYLLVGGASTLAPDRLEPRPTRASNAVFVPFAVLLPLAVWDFASRDALDPVIFAAGVVLFVAVVGRQMLSSVELRRAHAAMRESHQELLQAQHLARIGSWTWEARTQTSWWSPEMYRIFGVDPAQPPLGLDDLLALIAPDSRQIVQQALDRAAAHHEGWVLDVPMVAGRGAEWITLRGVVEVVRGQIVRLHGTVQDITRLKRTQIEADTLRRRFQAMLEHTHVGMFRTTLDGRILFANPAAATLLGYTSVERFLEEVPRITSLYIDLEERTQVLAVAKQHGGDPAVVRMRARGGQTVWVEVQAHQDVNEDGDPIIEGSLRDLTPQRERQEIAHRLATIVESSTEAIVSIDVTGRVQTWNAQAEALYGYTAEEAKGKQLADLVVPGERAEEHRLKLEGMREGRPMERHDTVRRRKDGSLVPVSMALSPLRDASGNVVGGAVSAHDITARIQAAEAERTRRENEQLRELEATLRDFINATAHDLNQPLTPMRFTVAALEERFGHEEGGRRGFALVHRSIDRMAMLVQDLLDVARLEAGTLRLEPVPADVAVLVREACEFFQPMAQARDIRITVDAPVPLPALVDAPRVTRVLHNLLANAMRFSRRLHEVRLEARTSDGAVEVRVVDTGAGLDPQQLARLFQRFSQTHGEGQGTGLGLYISRGIVEQHGGRIGAESAGPGSGSTFWFKIPTSPPGAPDRPPADQPVV